MIIDILSDQHIDFYFKMKKPKAIAIETTYSHIFTDNQKREVGDVLVVAGDIGHYNVQNINVLEQIKEVFGYKHIVCVLGNHDYYLIDNNSRSSYSYKSLFRAERMRNHINKKEGMYCLDGNIIEIYGVRFGGCDSWYDGEYIKKHFDEDGEKRQLWSNPVSDDYIHQLWKQTMYDPIAIHHLNWQEYADQEKEKIEKIYKDVDVMITHVNPSIKKEHTSASFREEPSTGFFTFNGSKYLKDGSMKYWIYGHTHVEAEFEINGVTCICNPMGYPGESGNGEWTWIKSVEI